MIAPTRLLCLVALVPTLLTLVLFVDAGAWPLVAVADTLLVALALMDLFTLPAKRSLRAHREFTRIATRGVRHPICVVIENRSGRSLKALVRDDQPAGLSESAQPIAATLPKRARTKIWHSLVASHRGTFPLEWVWARVTSRFGLWEITLRLSAKDQLQVYPALSQISRFALYARQNRMSLLGIRKARRVSTDNEFERLRDYSLDDQFRSIDWRATSRRLKLTVRDHQSNQSQRVVFLIDCGRMMVNQCGNQTLLDAAFDAALTLGYVTLSQHDEAGILCFSDQVLRWVPPAGGKRQLNRLVQAVHDVQPQLVESQLDQAFLHLRTHCRKRTLTILITNVIDDRNAAHLKAHMANLVGRHLPMAVLLRDHDLYDRVELPESSQGESPEKDRLTMGSHLYRAGAAADVLCWRREVLTDLRHAGVLTLDTFPESLTAPLVNEYLRNKGQHLL